MLIRTVSVGENVPGYRVKLRCPGCRVLATFDGIGQDIRIRETSSDRGRTDYVIGHRLCPDPNCRALVQFVGDAEGHRIVASYPPERLDFDSTNIPAAVRKTLEEAVACHASQCWIAAAMLVRKTLECLCKDKLASGQNLKERLGSLRSKVTMPTELFDALDDIRLLGNDAAHVEAKSYDDVGREEVEISLDFTKEVLKAVYQYSALLAKLKSLKK